MPEWLALCDLGVFWLGRSGFRTVLCCFLSHFLYGDFVCDVSLLLVFVSRHTNPFYNTKSLSFATVLYGPMSLCNVFRRFGCCFVCFLCFVSFVCLFCLFGRVLCFILHRDGLLDCVLVLLQHFFCGPSLKNMD